MREKKINSYGKAFLAGLPVMVVTMTIESLGLMPTMWQQQMYFLPAMQMPTREAELAGPRRRYKFAPG